MSNQILYSETHWDWDCSKIHATIGEELKNLFGIEGRELENLERNIYSAFLMSNPRIHTDKSIQTPQIKKQLESLALDIKKLLAKIEHMSIGKINEETLLSEEKLMNFIRLGYRAAQAEQAKDELILDIINRGGIGQLIDTEGTRITQTGVECFEADKLIDEIIPNLENLCLSVEKSLDLCRDKAKPGKKENTKIQEFIYYLSLTYEEYKKEKPIIKRIYSPHKNGETFSGDIICFYRLCEKFFGITSQNNLPLSDKAIWRIFNDIHGKNKNSTD